jgi:hypothetical protein
MGRKKPPSVILLAKLAYCKRNMGKSLFPEQSSDQLAYLIDSLAVGDRLARIHVVCLVIPLSPDVIGRDPAASRACIEVGPEPPVVPVALTIVDLAAPLSAPHVLGIGVGVALSDLGTGVVRPGSTDGRRPDVDP